MRTITTQVYQYKELSESAQAKARDWYREGGLDYEWWNFEQFIDAAKYLGIEIDRRKAHQDNSKQSTEPAIYFSGFTSQGDGACFLGTWRASEMRPIKELKADFATDETLHRLHRELWNFKVLYPEAICTSSRSSSHYSHERSTNLEAVLSEETDYNKATHEPLEECLVDFMRWIYDSLEEEYNYLNSDEAVADTIAANEYEFTETGKRA